jgi:hypothetical protein
VVSCKSENFELKGTDKRDRDTWVTFLKKISREAIAKNESLSGDLPGKENN